MSVCLLFCEFAGHYVMWCYWEVEDKKNIGEFKKEKKQNLYENMSPKLIYWQVNWQNVCGKQVKSE